MADLKIVIDTSDVTKAKAETRELKNTYTALDKAMKPLIAKEKAFAQTVRAVNDAMRLGLKTNKEAIADIQKLGKAYGYTEAQIDRVTASMTGVRKNTNRMNAVIQNAGYQFGDFFVQVQSGQNILVAFSQQGAQLAGLMPGIAGAVTGVGLVIGSMLARALMEGTNLFKSFAEASDEAKTAIEDLTSTTNAFGEALQGTVGPGAERFAEVVLRKKYNTAVKETTDQLAKLREELSPARKNNILDPTGITSLLNANRALNIVRTGAFEARVELVRLIDAINKPLDFNDMDELDQRLGDISRLIEEFDDQLTPKQLTGLIDAYTAVYERQQQLNDGNAELVEINEEVTNELKAQKAHLEAILKLEQARDRIAGSLDQKFAASTRKLELMRGGMGAGLAGTQVGMETSIAEAIAAERAVMEARQGIDGLFPSEVESHMLAFEQNLRTRLSGYMEEQAAIKELSSVSKAVTVERITDEERLQEKINQTLDSREAQVRLELKLLGLSKEEAELTKFIYDLEKQMGVTRAELNAEQQKQYDTIIALKEEYIQKTKEQVEATKRLEEAEKKVQAVSSTLASETVGALKSIVNGTKTASQAFRDMALNIIQQIMDILIWQPLIQSLTNSISGAISGSAGGGGTVGGIVSSIFGFQKGGAFSAGNVVPFANGGIVGSPTYFGMSGGRTGLMGEAGPEAIMPLKRGPNGKLGVEGSSSVTVNQTFQFAANGDESVKRIIAEAAPKIAKMTEVQIINSRQRGGQMRRAFG